MKAEREVSLKTYVEALEKRIAALEREVEALKNRPHAVSDTSLFGRVFGPRPWS